MCSPFCSKNLFFLQKSSTPKVYLFTAKKLTSAGSTIATFPLPRDFANLAPVDIPPEPPPAITTSYSLNDLEITFIPQNNVCFVKAFLNVLEEIAKL